MHRAESLHVLLLINYNVKIIFLELSGPQGRNNKNVLSNCLACELLIWTQGKERQYFRLILLDSGRSL